MARITINFQPARYPSGMDCTFSKDVQDFVGDAYEPLDLPATGAGLAAALCTPHAVTIHRMQMRKDIAKMLAQEITAAILESMRANDTKMGYKP